MVAIQTNLNAKVAPENAMGWTHVWAEGEQFPLGDDTAVALAIFGLIEYSPDDGPNARVYRCCDGVTLAQVKAAVT